MFDLKQYFRLPQDVVGHDAQLLSYWDTLPPSVQLRLLESTISVSTLGELKLLEEGDMYGYQMIDTLRRRSDHTFDLKAGTLYPLLHTLEERGYVVSYLAEEDGPRPRKYYRLTRRGAAVLREEAAAWQTYSGAVNAVLRACPGLDPA